MKRVLKNKIFKVVLFLSALTALLIITGMLYSLVAQSIPAFRHFGFFSFFGSSEWNAVIIGTLSTAILALLISVPFALALVLFNNVYCKETKIARWTSRIVDLCAQIPSVILGVWGYFSLRPALLSLNMGTYAFSILTTALVLAIMIIPYIASLSACFFAKIPQNITEGAYSLGATHTEVIRKVCFPLVGKGIGIACLMAFGKVLGETMIVCMLIGNENTITSVIVGQFEDANELRLSALFALALLLFLMTAIINAITIHIRKRIIL
jgi:phosphate transport system permease protein